MRAFKISLSVLFLLAALPTVFAASTKSDYQKDFDFGQLRTFTFKTERASNDPLASNTIVAQRIQDALANQFDGGCNSLKLNGGTGKLSWLVFMPTLNPWLSTTNVQRASPGVS